MTAGQQSRWNPTRLGRVKSRPALIRRSILLQFIMAKNGNVMGGRVESCLKMSSTLSLIVFNQSHVCWLGLPTRSPVIPRRLAPKGWGVITHKFMDALAHCVRGGDKKNRLLQFNDFSYFVKAFSLETFWAFKQSISPIISAPPFFYFYFFACFDIFLLFSTSFFFVFFYL